jgi:hypothetical protein
VGVILAIAAILLSAEIPRRPIISSYAVVCCVSCRLSPWS